MDVPLEFIDVEPYAQYSAEVKLWVVGRGCDNRLGLTLATHYLVFRFAPSASSFLQS